MPKVNSARPGVTSPCISSRIVCENHGMQDRLNRVLFQAWWTDGSRFERVEYDATMNPVSVLGLTRSPEAIDKWSCRRSKADHHSARMGTLPPPAQGNIGPNGSFAVDIVIVAKSQSSRSQVGHAKKLPWHHRVLMFWTSTISRRYPTSFNASSAQVEIDVSY